MSIEEYAQQMGISLFAARAAYSRNEIPFIRVGKLIRIPRSFIDQQLQTAMQGVSE